MIDVRAYVETLRGKPVAVFGLGISCLAAIRALVSAGAQVTAWDDQDAARLKGEEAGASILPIHEQSLEGYGALVLAPGVPLTHPAPHPVVERALEAGVEILSDIEILHRCGHGLKTIGVTGTNGKSTSTALVGHILEHAGRSALICGNIGVPVLDLDLPSQGGLIVMELSSFQLDLCPKFAPDIAALINMSQDHIDRHGSMEGYVEAKKRIFRGSGDAILGVDDSYSANIYDQVNAEGTRHAVSVSAESPLYSGVYVSGGVLFDALGADSFEVGEVHNIRNLHGAHNIQNLAIAYAICRRVGLEPQEIYDALQTYPGLAHRQYLARIINGVSYVNDSKATNGEAAGKALNCHKNIYWIVGGKAKEGGLDGLELYVDKIRKAYLIGEASEEFAKWMDSFQVEYVKAETMDHAVDLAHRAAQDAIGEPGGGGCVLLAPACASFDQYTSFEERGDHFTALVAALEESA